MKNLYEKLADIQKKLKAPKSQYNNFGKYPYRNCEDILEALKPLLGDCCLTISDEINLVADRIYVKATVQLALGEDRLYVSASAREALTKKGMDESQITGAASSYARKYALNGMFLIDDTKDADSHDNSQPVQLITKDQLSQLDKAISVADVDVKAICNAYHITTLSNLPSGAFDNAMSRLRASAQGLAA